MNTERLEELPMPGLTKPSGAGGVVTSTTHSVRCLLTDLTDDTQVVILEELLTRSLDGKDIVLLDKDKYSFQDRYYVVVTYLEKR